MAPAGGLPVGYRHKALSAACVSRGWAVSFFLGLLCLGAAGAEPPATAALAPAALQVFVRDGCPYCADAVDLRPTTEISLIDANTQSAGMVFSKWPQ